MVKGAITITYAQAGGGWEPPGIHTPYYKEAIMSHNKITNVHRNVIIIYSPRMAGYLMLRGFYLISVQPNLKHPGKNCFSFYDSPMLKDAMEDYLNRNIAA